MAEKENNSVKNYLIHQYMTERILTKWWQFKRKSFLDRVIHSLQEIIIPDEYETTKFVQSNTYFKSEIVDIRTREVDTRDELAINLLKRGFITYEHEKGKDHGKETITVKAIINVKK